jgi:tol-pal system protein YbgF
MRIIWVTLLSIGLATPFTAVAQQQETLADIRQQLTLIHVDMQRLKRELSTTGAASSTATGSTVLTRIDAIEAELQRLTSNTERLEHRINRIVSDGTNRIGDLEFRLVELEGGDVSQLGETTTLGGGDAVSIGAAIPATPSGDSELAVSERVDFDAGMAALDSGDFNRAVNLFEGFIATYPGSPLESDAQLRRGQAFEGGGEMTSAARAYLESYSDAPDSTVAPEALYRLGSTLGKLGQSNEACVTLNEVSVRHPSSEFVSIADDEMRDMGCS